MQEKAQKSPTKKGDYQYYQYFLWSKMPQNNPKNSFIGQQLTTIDQQFFEIRCKYAHKTEKSPEMSDFSF